MLYCDFINKNSIWDRTCKIDIEVILRSSNLNKFYDNVRNVERQMSEYQRKWSGWPLSSK